MGPIRWIKTNEELDKLIIHKHIVNYIKAKLVWSRTKKCQIQEQLRRYLNGIL